MATAEALPSPVAEGSSFRFRLPVWGFAAIVLSLSALLIFVLPLFIPTGPVHAASVSYLAGFNNRAAIVCAAGISVLVFCITLRGFTRVDANERNYLKQDLLPLSFVWLVAFTTALILGLCGWLVAGSHLRYLGDAGYIIEQATVRAETGRALYSQIEFAYGPLLLLPEVWLSRLAHCSMDAAYFAVLAMQAALGVALLGYVLNALPIRGTLRRYALVLFAIGAITPHLGLNYTFFRFVSPYAALLFATRTRSRWACALLLCVGGVLELLISPELGIALGIGAFAFGLFQAWRNGVRWLLVALLPPAVLGALLATLGRPFLHMTALFAGGALNLPVGPYPHLLVFLFALVWMVPFGLARNTRKDDPEIARWLAFYAMSLAFLPAALGRCDPLHVMFDGIGILLLSLVAVSGSGRRAQLAWVAAIAVLALWNQFVNQRPFEQRTAFVLRQTVMPHLPAPLRRDLLKAIGRKRADLAGVLSEPPQPDFHLDTRRLDDLTGVGSAVATPWEISPTVEQDLKRSHHYSPGFFAFGVDVMSPAAELRSIHDVNSASWMLLPRAGLGGDPHTLDHLAMFQGLTLPYRLRHAPSFRSNAAFEDNLAQHWSAVQDFGPYVLYGKDLTTDRP